MNNQEVIRQARTLISNPEHWTTGEAAKDANGQVVPSSDKNACKFCAVGAILHCGGDGFTILELEYVLGLVRGADPSLTPLAYVNDYEGREAVLKLFDAYLEQNP